MIEKYNHHGDDVMVQSHLKGRHTEHCLCYQGCDNFKPGREDNCHIAALLYRFCVLTGCVTPMWECPNYTSKEIKKDV